MMLAQYSDTCKKTWVCDETLIMQDEKSRVRHYYWGNDGDHESGGWMEMLT